MKMKVVEEEEDTKNYREKHLLEAAALAPMLNFQKKMKMKMKKDTEE